jgi:hypothetical protein
MVRVDLAAGLAAQLLEHVVDVLRVDHGAVDLDDAVAGLDAGACRRGVVDRRDDAQAAILLQHFDAEAAVLAGGVFVELGQAVLVQVLAVRVEPAEHAGDRGLHQGLVVDLFHIGLAHHFVDAAEIADVVQVDLIGAGTGMGRNAAAAAGAGRSAGGATTLAAAAGAVCACVSGAPAAAGQPAAG